MEQLILILLIALISFINWVIKKSAEVREKRRLEKQARRGDLPSPAESGEWEPPSDTRPPARGEDESMRRLMEALGLPPDEVPPPVSRRPAAPPPLPEPVLTAEPPPVPVPRPASPVPATPPVLPTLAPRASRRAPLRSATVEVPTNTPQGSVVRQLLASPDGLRKAIILSEVLGAPKALRS